MSDAEGERFSGCSVLVVEGDAESARDLHDKLEAVGCQVFLEAMVSGFQHPEDLAAFSVIFIDRAWIDRVLPQIQAVAPAVPVIVTSGEPNIRGAVAAIQRGAADYLLKPVQPDELKAALANALAFGQATEAYQREKAFSENLLDLVPAIILVLDVEGRIVRFNRFMEQLSGCRLEEVKGRDWFETFLIEEDQPLVRQAVQKLVAESGETVSGNVNRIVTRTGQHRQISWRCTTIRNARDEVTGILAAGQDVTDLLAAQKKASRSGRLATIGQTVATLSHETRNELHALQMGLELLPQVLDEPEESLEIIESLKHEQARLSRLFEDVRGFAAPMKLERTNHGLSEIWRSAWDSIEAIRQERHASLRERIDAPTVQCYVDGFRLQQVFRNLFENALAACSDPVEISVTCSRAEHQGREALQIFVRDNGPGIPAGQHDTVFDAFVTTKQGGTGLGLALTKRVIEAHHGSIEVGRSSDGGAEFIITLPIASEIAGSLEAQSAVE